MQIKVLISGHVQGVFLRVNTEKQAKKLNLKGYIKNLTNGKVEAVFQGTKSNINKILNWLKTKSPAEITDMKIKELEEQDYTNFEIKY